jgi:SAM-dependent methyltransferase
MSTTFSGCVPRNKTSASPIPEPQFRCDYLFWWEATPSNLEVIAQAYPELRSGGVALDLGCGSARFKAPIVEFGFRYIGIDLPGSGAPLIGDALRLPIATEAVDLVLAWALFEHLADPWQGVAELARVAKPGSLLLGAVAFLEPFHESYFHMTRWGLNEILASNGFMLERMWPHWHLVSSFSLMYNPWLGGRAHRFWQRIAPFFVKLLHRYRMSRRCRYQLPPDVREHPQAEVMDYLSYCADIAFLARREKVEI